MSCPSAICSDGISLCLPIACGSRSSAYLYPYSVVFGTFYHLGIPPSSYLGGCLHSFLIPFCIDFLVVSLPVSDFHPLGMHSADDTLPVCVISSSDPLLGHWCGYGSPPAESYQLEAFLTQPIWDTWKPWRWIRRRCTPLLWCKPYLACQWSDEPSPIPPDLWICDPGDMAASGIPLSSSPGN